MITVCQILNKQKRQWTLFFSGGQYNYLTLINILYKNTFLKRTINECFLSYVTIFVYIIQMYTYYIDV